MSQPEQPNTAFPTQRDIGKGFYLVRTPDKIGNYLDAKTRRLITDPREPIARFLVGIRIDDKEASSKIRNLEYHLGNIDASTLRPLTSLPECEVDALEKAFRAFLEPENATKFEIELRKGFRLPDPDIEPDTYWMYGPDYDRRLLILWGCELKRGSSLPLMNLNNPDDPRTVLGKIKLRKMQWSDRQALAIESIRASGHTLSRFLVNRQFDRQGNLVSLLGPGFTVKDKQIRNADALPGGEVAALESAASQYYLDGRNPDSELSDFERELRASFRLPPPSTHPERYFRLGGQISGKLMIAVDGEYAFEETLPVMHIEDEEAAQAAPAIAQDEPDSIVAQLQQKVVPIVKYMAFSGAAIVVLMTMVIISILTLDRTPPVWEDIAFPIEDKPSYIDLVFSEGIAPESILEPTVAEGEPPQPPTFSVFDDANQPVEISKSEVVDPGNIVRLHLRKPLIEGNVRVTLLRITDDSNARNPLPEDQRQKAVQFYDAKPPALVEPFVSAEGSDPRRLNLYFDEPLDANSSARPANFQIEGFRVEEATMGDDPKVITIVVDNPFANKAFYDVTITGVSDTSRNRNMIRDGVTHNFQFVDQLPPKIRDFEPKAQNSFFLTFNEPVQERSISPSAFVITFSDTETGTEMQAAIRSATLQQDEMIVELRGGPLFKNIEYTLTVTGISDKATPPNTIETPEVTTFFYDGPEDRKPPELARSEIQGKPSRLMGRDRIKLEFNEPIDLSVPEIFRRFRIVPTDANVIEVSANPSDPTVIYIDFTGELDMKRFYRVRVAEVQDLNGNVASNLNTGWFSPDAVSTPNQLIKLKVDVPSDGKTLRVNFSDAVTADSVSNPANYTLYEGVRVKEIQFDESYPKRATLILEGKLTNDAYLLSVEGLRLSKLPSRAIDPVQVRFQGPF